MTGYGRANGSQEKMKVAVEIKSLNSKFLDLRYKSPAELSNREIEIRQIVKDTALRGKIDLDITLQFDDDGEHAGVDTALIMLYARSIESLATERGMTQSQILDSVLRLPSVWEIQTSPLTDSEFDFVIKILEEALQRLMSQREQEGQSIQNDMNNEVNNIRNLEKTLDNLAEKRNELIRQKLDALMAKYITPEKVDANRFEQEMIYYLEKIDIHEERQRLQHHCEYFLETMDSPEIQQGKKLSFISQEMGREINTLGAKAYSSEVQKVVVEMKNSLEKIKEQVANVL